MILVLFLTVGGLALAVQSFGRYDTLLLEQSDSQLYGLARSVDRSVSGATATIWRACAMQNATNHESERTNRWTFSPSPHGSTCASASVLMNCR